MSRKKNLSGKEEKKNHNVLNFTFDREIESVFKC